MRGIIYNSITYRPEDGMRNSLIAIQQICTQVGQ